MRFSNPQSFAQYLYGMPMSGSDGFRAPSLPPYMPLRFPQPQAKTPRALAQSLQQPVATQAPVANPTTPQATTQIAPVQQPVQAPQATTQTAPVQPAAPAPVVDQRNEQRNYGPPAMMGGGFNMFRPGGMMGNMNMPAGTYQKPNNTASRGR